MDHSVLVYVCFFTAPPYMGVAAADPMNIPYYSDYSVSKVVDGKLSSLWDPTPSVQTSVFPIQFTFASSQVFSLFVTRNVG